METILLETDYEILEQAFGSGYFVLFRMKNKILLSEKQKAILSGMIEERNHFEILFFINALRAKSFN